MTSAACRTNFLRAEPLHHVAGVAAVAAVQTEVGRAADGHVADGALEGETLAHGALRASGLAPTVAAVHTKLCGTETQHRFIEAWNILYNKRLLTSHLKSVFRSEFIPRLRTHKTVTTELCLQHLHKMCATEFTLSLDHAGSYFPT